MAFIKNKKARLPNISLTNAYELAKVFASNGWVIEEDNSNSRFSRYIKLLNFLNNDDEQKFIIELTRRFLHIKMEDYCSEIITAINSLLESNPGITQYYVLPIKPKSFGNSSYTIAYLFKGESLRERINFGDINFRVIENIDKFKEIKKNNSLKMHEKVLFVDDFIGSGDTGINAKNMLSEMTINDGKMVFLSIVAHKMGKERLENKGFSVYCSHQIDKGISDFYKNDEMLAEKNEIMIKIEERIPALQDEFKFGYKQCEALVCMERVPNNTFPIYWLHENSPYKRS